MLSFINVSVDPSILQFSASPTWDLFLVIFFVFAVFAYSFFVNRERLAVILLSVYSALALLLNTPLILNAFGTLGPDIYRYRLGSFVVLFLVLYILLSHHMSLRSDVGHSWWQAFLLSFMQVGLFMSSILLFVPSTYFESRVATEYLTGDLARSFWMIAPLASMIIMRKRGPSPMQHF